MDLKHIKTKCDHCSKAFKLKQKMIKETNITDKISKLSFKCPHCKHVYIIGYKDEEINSNAARIGELLEEIRVKEKWEPMELDNLMKRISNLKERNYELNARYKAIYGG